MATVGDSALEKLALGRVQLQVVDTQLVEDPCWAKSFAGTSTSSTKVKHSVMWSSPMVLSINR